MNLEIAVTEEMIAIACEVQPEYVCLVPEKREELTTEGGLDVAGQLDTMLEAIAQLKGAGIKVSLFIDADKEQIDAAVTVGAPYIELHTGCYADASNSIEQQSELERIAKMAKYAHSRGLVVNAGHGLHYHNVEAIAAIPEIYELNIGHSIIARASIIGLDQAVRDIRAKMVQARAMTAPL